jgi:hypothetical protein
MDVLAVNSSHWMSEIGARLAPDCDFAVIWYYDHEDRINKVSLRAFHDAVDVSEIAKGFGGGGHKKAAGFQISGDLCVDDIFDLEEDCEKEADNDDTVLDENCENEKTSIVEEIKEDLKVLAKKVEEAEYLTSGST